jgi:thiol:disulfide interchange protein DsbC
MLNRSTLRRAVLAAGALLLAAAAAHASPDIEVVKNSVKAVTKLDVEKIEPSKIQGLYEVQAGGQLFYTDAKGEYILLGAHVFTTKGNENYTEKRMNELAGYRFADLPLKDAVKIVRGTGKHVVVTFEDANCGYCKQLNKTLEEVGDTTHYVFIIGILGDDSIAKAKAIWCSANPAKTWSDWMIAGKPVPMPGAECETPIARNGKLGERYRIQGTPAVFFPNGDRAPGAIPADQLLKYFAKQPQ